MTQIHIIAHLEMVNEEECKTYFKIKDEWILSKVYSNSEKKLQPTINKTNVSLLQKFQENILI